MRVWVGIVAAAILAAALPTVAQPARPPFPTRPLSPAGQALADDWRAKVDAVRAELAALPPPASVTEHLARRNRLQREARLALSPIFPAPAEERGWILALVWNELAVIDDDNTDALKRVMPATGWFADPELSHEAWDIAQHANDWEFQRVVLTRVEPLAGRGAVSGSDFAKLYDRVAQRDGRPQRFATQVSCRAGTLGFGDVEDIDRVDAFRAAVGHAETLVETRARLKVGLPC
ncbi:DUF6624 domain-containing protein [Phenylobacterium sp.]|uniref:DUF6624 domain-containing protein n=1 Tax=Phenylobacterium sp. TaxID=1871053 RepID=UPI002FDFB19C